MKYVDLHIHSKSSDGTDAVPALLEKIRDAGIEIFALTDHDTINGVLEVEKIISEDTVLGKNLTFIKGIEFSCISEAGKCHILGYDYDYNNASFRDILQEGRDKRRVKLERRLEYLEKERKIPFTDEEKTMLRNLDMVGKPHLGNLLVEKGKAVDMVSAIEEYINPCKTESTRLDAKAAVKAILASGGIPVWAHPYGGSGEKDLSESEFKKQLKVLVDAGIKGLECYYSKYTMDQVDSLLRAAKANKLLISGGSDYHGTNKKVTLHELNADGIDIDAEKLTILNTLL